MSKLAIVVLCGLSLWSSVMQSQTGNPASNADSLTNVLALGGGTALVQGQHGTAFALWKVNTGTKWSSVILPPVGGGQSADESGSPADWTDLEFAGGQPMLFAIVDHGTDTPPKQTLVQATTADMGAHWKVVSAPLTGAEWMTMMQYVPVDALHAWLLLASDGGAGQLPSALFTTANGGVSWTKVQDSMHANTMGLGMNAPMLLHAKNALLAWFVVDCVNCDPDTALSVFLTRDGGRLWQKERLPKATFCTDCMPVDLTDDSARTKGCVSSTLMTDTPGVSKTEHFCTANDGLTWTAPVAGRTPLSAGVAPLLAVSANCKDMPKDAQHADAWSQCVLQETRDGGKTFTTILPEVNGKGPSAVASFSASGNDAWAIVSMNPPTAAGASYTLLVYSGDKGATWKVLAK